MVSLLPGRSSFAAVAEADVGERSQENVESTLPQEIHWEGPLDFFGTTSTHIGRVARPEAGSRSDRMTCTVATKAQSG